MTAFDTAARTSAGPSRLERDRAGRSNAAPNRDPGAVPTPAPLSTSGRLATLDVLHLQGMAGNAAVTSLVAPGATLQRDPIAPGTDDEPATAPAAASGGDTAAPAADPATRPELHPGDGPTADVGVLQQKLNATGAATPALRVTAVYGPATTAAVISFQTNHSLAPSGVADAPTWTELDRLAPSVVRNGRIVVDTPGGASPQGVPEGGTHPTIRRGSTGPAVEELQQRLNNAPSTEVPTLLEVDGKFGSLTRRAVVEFQTAHPPLAKDGAVGPQTWAMVDQVPGAVTVGRVETSWRERVEGNLYFQNTKYTWRLTDDALEVSVNIRFTGLRNHPQIAVWLGQIQTIWNTFKFVDESDPSKQLRLTMVPNRASPGDSSVRVYSAAPGTDQFRSDSANWNVQDPDPGLAPHEFGHLIGLQDEYSRGADAYPVVTGEETPVGEVAGDAEPQTIADELWAAVNSTPASGRAAKTRQVISNHTLVSGAFSQRVAEAYETTHAAEMKREDFVDGVGYRVVPNPGGRIEEDLAARLPGQDDEGLIAIPFTYENRSIMGGMQSLANPRGAGGVTSAHDHPVEERHVRNFLEIVRANRPGTWRIGRL
jgi:peptidoglycan hydrolase-like protein with peptidoglycan-binding domain